MARTMRWVAVPVEEHNKAMLTSARRGVWLHVWKFRGFECWHEIYIFVFFPTLFRSRIDVRDRDDTEVINIKNCLSGLGNILLDYYFNLTLNSTVTDQLSVLLGHFSAISSQ